MLRLGGEIGDGVLLSGGCSPGYIARCVGDIKAGAEKAGKTLKQCDVAGFVTAAVSEDREGSGRSQQAVSRLYFSQCAPRREYSSGRRHHRSGRTCGGGCKTRLGGGQEIHQRRGRLTHIRSPARRRIAASSSRRSSMAAWIFPSFCPPVPRKRESKSSKWRAGWSVDKAPPFDTYSALFVYVRRLGRLRREEVGLCFLPGSGAFERGSQS